VSVALAGCDQLAAVVASGDGEDLDFFADHGAVAWEARVFVEGGLDDARLDALVDTLLYEGYALYPYTPGATKNATPTPFGIVYPPAYAASNSSSPPSRSERSPIAAIV